MQNSPLLKRSASPAPLTVHSTHDRIELSLYGRREKMRKEEKEEPPQNLHFQLHQAFEEKEEVDSPTAPCVHFTLKDLFVRGNSHTL